jgi:hypothetical protein
VRRLVSVVLAPVMVVALALGIGSWASGRAGDSRPSLVQALDVMPAATLVAGFTDWRSVRSRLGVGRARTAAARAALADQGSLRDLTTRSVLGGLVDEMHDKLGWSAADVDWEAYSRAESGSAMAARLSDDVSLDEVEERLERLGYTRRGDVWTLAPDDAAVLSPQAADTLAAVSVVRDRRLVVAADRPAPVRDVLATVRGDAPSALSNRPLVDVAQALAGSDTAVLQGRAFGCRATSVGGADATVQAQARAAVARHPKALVADVHRPRPRRRTRRPEHPLRRRLRVADRGQRPADGAVGADDRTVHRPHRTRRGHPRPASSLGRRHGPDDALRGRPRQGRLHEW